MAPVSFALIHSPLVGPLTWEPVADSLRQRGHTVLVPQLSDDPASPRPFWQQHAQAVAQALAPLNLQQPLVLVAHSGAGPLLPAIRQQLARPVAAYLFVDAGIPQDGLSRLALMAQEDPAAAQTFQAGLAGGGRYPTWSAADLATIIPNPALCQRLAAEVCPRPLAFYDEPIPVFPGWPDAPAAYLQLSDGYDVPARQAVQRGWLVQHLHAHHFHMLVAPKVVARALLELVESQQIQSLP
jgi:hypothetical protein